MNKKSYHGDIDSTFGMMLMLMPMMSHNEKNNVAPNFDYLDERNAMMPLTVLSTSHVPDTNGVASHDTNTNASGIT